MKSQAKNLTEDTKKTKMKDNKSFYTRLKIQQNKEDWTALLKQTPDSTIIPDKGQVNVEEQIKALQKKDLKTLVQQFKIDKLFNKRLILCRKYQIRNLSFYDYIRIYNVETITDCQDYIDIPYEFMFHRFACHLRWHIPILILRMPYLDRIKYQADLDNLRDRTGYNGTEYEYLYTVIPHDPEIILHLLKESRITIYNFASIKTLKYLYSIEQSSEVNLEGSDKETNEYILPIKEQLNMHNLDWSLITQINKYLTAEDILDNPQMPFYKWQFPRPTIEMCRIYPGTIHIEFLSSSPRITFDQILRNRGIPWDWDYVSRNPNLTIQIVDRFKLHFPFNMKYIVLNPMNQPELTRHYRKLYSQIITSIKY